VYCMCSSFEGYLTSLNHLVLLLLLLKLRQALRVLASGVGCCCVLSVISVDTDQQVVLHLRLAVQQLHAYVRVNTGEATNKRTHNNSSDSNSSTHTAAHTHN
jgi:hypothetical protein